MTVSGFCTWLTMFCRLKEVIPSITAKDNVTQLDIVLEAIRYIDSLQHKLANKLDAGELELVRLGTADTTMEKENQSES